MKGFKAKPIICFGNTLSFVITVAQNIFRKKLSKNFELDCAFLLEVSIKGNLLRFTDDKGERCKIDKRLGRTVAAVYRKTIGRAKTQFDKNAKKFHVFKEQLKSRQLAEKEV